MKTTIDLPEAIFERTKIAAARRRTTLKNLVIQGLEVILKEEESTQEPTDALKRLRRGYHLGSQTLNRDETHAR